MARSFGFGTADDAKSRSIARNPAPIQPVRSGWSPPRSAARGLADHRPNPAGSRPPRERRQGYFGEYAPGAPLVPFASIVLLAGDRIDPFAPVWMPVVLREITLFVSLAVAAVAPPWTKTPVILPTAVDPVIATVMLAPATLRPLLSLFESITLSSAASRTWPAPVCRLT